MFLFVYHLSSILWLPYALVVDVDKISGCHFQPCQFRLLMVFQQNLFLARMVSLRVRHWWKLCPILNHCYRLEWQLGIMQRRHLQLLQCLVWKWVQLPSFTYAIKQAFLCKAVCHLIVLLCYCRLWFLGQLEGS